MYCFDSLRHKHWVSHSLYRLGYPCCSGIPEKEHARHSLLLLLLGRREEKLKGEGDYYYYYYYYYYSLSPSARY
jgi:hypothetical protein